MKKTCSQIKDSSRAALLGNYSTLIAVSVLLEFLVSLFNIPFVRLIGTGMYYTAPSRVILGFAGSLVVSLIAMIFSAGITYMHLMVSRGRNILFSDFLYCLRNRPDKYLGYGLILSLISYALVVPGTVCMALAAAARGGNSPMTFRLVMLGILLYAVGLIADLILMLGLSLGIYLLLDNPGLTVREAAGESLRYMRGNKWQLFVLYLSFIGWYLLGILTLGLGFLWIQQYVNQSSAQFYLDVVYPQSDSENTNEYWEQGMP